VSRDRCDFQRKKLKHNANGQHTNTHKLARSRIVFGSGSRRSRDLGYDIMGYYNSSRWTESGWDSGGGCIRAPGVRYTKGSAAGAVHYRSTWRQRWQWRRPRGSEKRSERFYPDDGGGVYTTTSYHYHYYHASTTLYVYYTITATAADAAAAACVPCRFAYAGKLSSSAVVFVIVVVAIIVSVESR